jgi:hypothetical protein
MRRERESGIGAPGDRRKPMRAKRSRPPRPSNGESSKRSHPPRPTCAKSRKRSHPRRPAVPKLTKRTQPQRPTPAKSRKRSHAQLPTDPKNAKRSHGYEVWVKIIDCVKWADGSMFVGRSYRAARSYPSGKRSHDDRVWEKIVDCNEWEDGCMSVGVSHRTPGRIRRESRADVRAGSSPGIRGDLGMPEVPRANLGILDDRCSKR